MSLYTLVSQTPESLGLSLSSLRPDKIDLGEGLDLIADASSRQKWQWLPDVRFGSRLCKNVRRDMILLS
jgi:hypothetical protein